jgi:hypothetical protein
MTGLYRVDMPVVLPSGEQADWSWWLQAALDSDAVNAANAFQGSLGGSTAWKALYSSTTLFGLPKISAVDQATGQILRTMSGTGTYAGTGITNPFPPQLSVCVSLRTSRSGARYRGRFYLPAPLASNGDTIGRIVAARVTDVTTALSTAFSAAIGVGPSVIVMIYSRVGRSVEPVLSLDVGNVMDTQRRRRDKLVEVRTSVPI